MRWGIFALLGITSAQAVSGIRVLTGECRAGQDLMGIETAKRVVYGITGRKHDLIPPACINSSIARHASKPWAAKYKRRQAVSRMVISRQLFDFLLEFSRDEGGVERETDAQFVWEEYVSRHRDDTTDCAKMYVWYTTVFGMGNPGMLTFSDTSVEIREEHQGLVAYVDLVRVASQATPEDQLSPIDRPTCSYERYVAAQPAVADMTDLDAALGRPARFVTAGDLEIIRSHRDRILSDYERTEVPELDAMRLLGPKLISLSEEWIHLEQPSHVTWKNDFVERLMHEITSESFPYIAPSWYEVRQLLKEEFPELREPNTPEYKNYRAMAEKVVEAITIPGNTFQGVLEQSLSPASLESSQIAWVTRVLVPNIGKSVGSLDLVRGRTHIYRGYIPRSMEVVRELLEARFGAMSMPPRKTPVVVVPVRSLLHRIPDRKRIFDALNPEPVVIAKRARVADTLPETERRDRSSTNGLALLLQAISSRGD
jgi:hypothetical protein